MIIPASLKSRKIQVVHSLLRNPCDLSFKKIISTYLSYQIKRIDPRKRNPLT